MKDDVIALYKSKEIRIALAHFYNIWPVEEIANHFSASKEFVKQVTTENDRWIDRKSNDITFYYGDKSEIAYAIYGYFIEKTTKEAVRKMIYAACDHTEKGISEAMAACEEEMKKKKDGKPSRL
ncbi:hypothetical protein [Microbulbifer sp. SSSA005]|uniref:hypothetical protein n=1 Tax=Microbulbifer sp. SSSA005 TaxID=3243378 RepID=UPI0040390CED